MIQFVKSDQNRPINFVRKLVMNERWKVEIIGSSQVSSGSKGNYILCVVHLSSKYEICSYLQLKNNLFIIN